GPPPPAPPGAAPRGGPPPRAGGPPPPGAAPRGGGGGPLPAVSLLAAPPAGDPIALRFEPGALPPAVFRLRETDEHLVHVPVLRAPFAAVLPSALDPDELGEISVDHPRYRALLQDALRGVAVPVSGAQGPAASPRCPGAPPAPLLAP